MKHYTGPNGEKRTRVKLSELPPISEERLAEIAAIPDEDIDTSDVPELDDEFWELATVGWPPPQKTKLSLRLDTETLDWFKSKGRRYQSRINAVLREYVQAQKLAEAKEQGRQEAQATK